MIAAIVLAAGASRRLGRNKLLLPFRGGTVLSVTIARVLDSPVERVVLVLGHERELVRARAGLPEDARLSTVDNPDWESGMASSLRAGALACRDAEAVIVALGDQPGIEPAVITRLVEAHAAGARLSVPVHADPQAREGERIGHPVLFARPLLAELLALEGDAGARQVVERHWSEVARVEGTPLRDVDTEADYAALVAGTPATNEGLETPPDRRRR